MFALWVQCEGLGAMTALRPLEQKEVMLRKARKTELFPEGVENVRSS